MGPGVNVNMKSENGRDVPLASSSGRPIRQTRISNRYDYDDDDDLDLGYENGRENGHGSHGHGGRSHEKGSGLQDAEWTSEEAALLEAGMQRFPAERFSSLQRYLKIAATLPNKGARDVALRIRWLQRNGQNGKKRKVEEAVVRKAKSGKGEAPGRLRESVFSITAPSQPLVAPPPPVMPPPPPPPPVITPPPFNQLPSLLDNNTRPAMQLGGPIGTLLDNNVGLMHQIRQNISSQRVNENTELLGVLRDNINSIMSSMTTLPGITQLPPLPVKLNVELANSLLPPVQGAVGIPAV